MNKQLPTSENHLVTTTTTATTETASKSIETRSTTSSSLSSLRSSKEASKLRPFSINTNTKNVKTLNAAAATCTTQGETAITNNEPNKSHSKCSIHEAANGSLSLSKFSPPPPPPPSPSSSSSSKFSTITLWLLPNKKLDLYIYLVRKYYSTLSKLLFLLVCSLCSSKSKTSFNFTKSISKSYFTTLLTHQHYFKRHVHVRLLSQLQILCCCLMIISPVTSQSFPEPPSSTTTTSSTSPSSSSSSLLAATNSISTNLTNFNVSLSPGISNVNESDFKSKTGGDSTSGSATSEDLREPKHEQLQLQHEQFSDNKSHQTPSKISSVDGNVSTRTKQIHLDSENVQLSLKLNASTTPSRNNNSRDAFLDLSSSTSTTSASILVPKSLQNPIHNSTNSTSTSIGPENSIINSNSTDFLIITTEVPPADLKSNHSELIDDASRRCLGHNEIESDDLLSAEHYYSNGTATDTDFDSDSASRSFPLPLNNNSLRILSQIRRDLSQRIGTGKVARVVSDDFEIEDELEIQECDRVFVSIPGGPTNGTFESPKLIAEEDRSVQCIFTFVPRPGERVQIAFTRFNVRGIPPECVHEWIDLYTEVDGTDVTDLISTPFAGRYCGLIPPRPRISLFGGIAIGFYSDRNVTDDDEIRFSGRYNFISDDRYMVGTPVPRTICSFTILGTSKRQGELRSPTYPGIYPKDLACTYKFIGTVGQRIRIEFRDFDVFSGGPNCPFDDVKVYDGMEPTSPIIGTFCGPQRYLVVFSSEHLMFVTFTTRERTFESQNRGFTALWEFSESFVKLDFIGKNAGTHIRGTECDQVILSKGQSQGAVYSPNYPFPYLPKIYCKYFIYGLQDPQHLERVKLSFEKFDVPSSTQSEEDVTSHHKDKEQKCGDGHVKIYIKGQEVFGGFDKPDFEFCGKDIPEPIQSDQPRLVLAFSSGEIQGSGFKARYAFEIEYRIPGTPAPDHSCHFTYYSSSNKHGEFNSPRYPSNYPSNMSCTYLFISQPNEQVRIVFDHFKIRTDKVNYTGGAYGNDICIQDYVEIYNVFKTRKDRLIGRYCSKSAPGPVESHEEAEAVKVILHLDEEGVYSGFKARYVFFTSKSLFGECGTNYSAALSGALTSPGWPGIYEGPKNREGSFRCNWFLAVKTGSRILLHFQIFSVEGHPNDRGCPAAAVRVWEDPEGLPIELCGEGLAPELSQFVSTKNYMQVTFITADKAVGDRGFLAVWSEVIDKEGPTCLPNYIPCSKNAFCIPEELHCDGVKNCGNIVGEADESDESLCGLDSEVNVILIMVLSIASGSCCILTLCVWGQRNRRNRRRRMQLRRPPIHVCDNAGARFAAMDSV